MTVKVVSVLDGIEDMQVEAQILGNLIKVIIGRQEDDVMKECT